MVLIITFTFVIAAMLLFEPSFSVATWVTLVINLVSFIVYIKKYKNGQLVCFEFFFSITFFLALYSYYFLQDTTLGYTVTLAVSHIQKSSSYVKGTLFASLLYEVFLLGCISAVQTKSKPFRPSNFYVPRVIEILVTAMTLLLFVLFLTNNLSSFMVSKSQGGALEAYTFVYWLNMLMLLWMSVVFMKNKSEGINTLGRFLRKNVFFCVICSFLILVYLISGHRHFGIGLVLATLFLYHYCIHKVPIRVVLLLSIIGFIAMAIIGFTRKGEFEGINAMGTVGFFRDFLTASLATPFFIEYTAVNGITYGSNYLLQITSIIPFLSGFIVALGFVPAPASYDVFTGMILDDIYSGLGTSLVGDVFYSFGFAGSLIVFFFLGYSVSWLYRRLVQDGSQSMYAVICYVVLMSSSFFMPRNDLLSFLRTIGFLCIIYFGLSLLEPKQH